MKPILFLAAVLFSQSLWAQLPNFVRIKDVQIEGSACKAQTANAFLSPDLREMSILFDRYSVDIGKGTENSGSRALEKGCDIIVSLEVAPAWAPKIESLIYRGFANLPSGHVAYHIIKIDSTDLGNLGVDILTLNGPKQGLFGQEVKVSSINDKLACMKASTNATVNRIYKIRIHSRIGVRNLLGFLSKPQSSLNVDSADAAIRQDLKLTWQKCF